MDTNNAKNSQTYEFPPSPYGTYFELKTNHFQLEEATRSGSFDMNTVIITLLTKSTTY